jgi:hypothetical protein
MQRNFKPMPADHIDDEDERCRVNNRAFVAKRKRSRERKEKFVFGILAATGILLAIYFGYVLSLPI